MSGGYLWVQIDPLRVLLFNQSDLPIPPPLLQLLFTGNGRERVIIDFEPNELVDRVSFREACDRLALVFINATNDVVRHAEIQRSVLVAGEEVDVVGHARLEKWIPGSRFACPGMTMECC